MHWNLFVFFESFFFLGGEGAEKLSTEVEDSCCAEEGVVVGTLAEDLAGGVVGTLCEESLTENLLGGAGSTSAGSLAEDPVLGVEATLFPKCLVLDLYLMFSNTYFCMETYDIEHTVYAGK